MNNARAWTRPHRLLRPVAALTFAVAVSAPLLTACADSDEPQDDLEQAVALPVDASQVVVNDPGQGPGRVIAFHGAEEEYEQDLSVAVSEGFNQTLMHQDAVDVQAPTDADVTTITLPMSGTVEPAEEPDAEGELPATRSVDYRVGVPESSNLDLAEDLQTAEGFRLGWRSTDDGQPSTYSLRAPQGASDEGRAMVEQSLLSLTSLPVIFPEDPIGEGASWSVDSRVTGDSTLLQTTTYTLTGLDGDRVEMDVSVSQRPALGALSLEGQPGAEDLQQQNLDVLNSNTSSEGSLVVDLSKPLPVDGEVAYTTRVIYGGADELRVVQDSTTAFEFN